MTLLIYINLEPLICFDFSIKGTCWMAFISPAGLQSKLWISAVKICLLYSNNYFMKYKKSQIANLCLILFEY